MTIETPAYVKYAGVSKSKFFVYIETVLKKKYNNIRPIPDGETADL